MSTPAIIWLCLHTLGMGVVLADHGKPKTGKHNFYVNLVASAIINTLLYCGGFFK